MRLTGVGNYAYKRPQDDVLVTHRLLEGLAGTTASDVPCLALALIKKACTAR